MKTKILILALLCATGWAASTIVSNVYDSDKIPAMSSNLDAKPTNGMAPLLSKPMTNSISPMATNAPVLPNPIEQAFEAGVRYGALAAHRNPDVAEVQTLVRIALQLYAAEQQAQKVK